MNKFIHTAEYDLLDSLYLFFKKNHNILDVWRKMDIVSLTEASGKFNNKETKIIVNNFLQLLIKAQKKLNEIETHFLRAKELSKTPKQTDKVKKDIQNMMLNIFDIQTEYFELYYKLINIINQLNPLNS